MEQELLILPEHPWLTVEFVNTTGNTNGVGTINPSGASLIIVEFVNTKGNTNGAGTINPSGASLVYSRVREQDG